MILDTELPEVQAWQHVFDRHGCQFPDSWWQNAIGRGADQIVETPFDILEELASVKIDRHEVDAVRRRVYDQIMSRQDALPGVRDLLGQAKAAGIHTGVASSSKHSWVDGYLLKLGLLDTFDAIVCADDVSRAKPFPDLYLRALELLRAAPERTVALEDSPNGIRAAKAAGLYCVAVPNTLTRQLDLTQADQSVDSLATIDLAWIESLVAARF